VRRKEFGMSKGSKAPMPTGRDGGQLNIYSHVDFAEKAKAVAVAEAGTKQSLAGGGGRGHVEAGLSLCTQTFRPVTKLRRGDECT
jgi:hypothetical protein